MTSIHYSLNRAGATSRGRTESPAPQRSKYSTPSSLIAPISTSKPASKAAYTVYPLINRSPSSNSSRYTQQTLLPNSAYELYSYNRSNLNSNVASASYLSTPSRLLNNSSLRQKTLETHPDLQYSNKTELTIRPNKYTSTFSSRIKLDDSSIGETKTKNLEENLNTLKLTKTEILSSNKITYESDYLTENGKHSLRTGGLSQFNPSPSSTLSNYTSSSSTQSIRNTNSIYSNGFNGASVSETLNHESENNSNQKGSVGLKNLGNTCFMNSILQCLSNTKCLLEYVLTGSYSNDLNTTLSTMKGSLFQSYATLIKKMWKSNDIAINPQDLRIQLIRYSPSFSGYAQQDAEEFLTYLIKGLHEDVNLVKSKPAPYVIDEKTWDRMTDTERSEAHWAWNFRAEKSKISDMFVGQLKSTLMCTKCDYRSPTYELFWDLAVPIPTKNSSVKLDDCIKLFMSEEILDGENKPVCSTCKVKRRCAKRYTIEKLPKILVIHLKRFLKARFNNKINLNVDYPIEGLDMSKYLSCNVDSNRSSTSNSVYDLYGISLHSGTESSGHYVAYCKNPYNKKWFCFNDQTVREISYSSLQDSNAYILFYQLRS